MKRAIAAATFTVGIFVAMSARAELPTMWDRARDPELDRRLLHERAAREMLDVVRIIRQNRDEGPSKRARMRNAAEGAKQLLEGVTQGGCPDAESCFSLGEALDDLEEDAEAAAVLERAIAKFPEDPAANDAIFQLALAYARLNRRDEELHAYDRFLERNVERSSRFVALLNRAESRMALGDRDGAVVDYEEAIQIQPDRHGVLARWGLTFTHDRSGDFSSAVQEAKKAAVLDGFPSAIDGAGVFYVPGYDREWYHALVEIGLAESAELPSDQARHWGQAATYYGLWLGRAAKDDKWIPLAKSRKKLCERTAERRKKDAPKQKPQLIERDEMPVIPPIF